MVFKLCDDCQFKGGFTICFFFHLRLISGHNQLFDKQLYIFLISPFFHDRVKGMQLREATCIAGPPRFSSQTAVSIFN